MFKKWDIIIIILLILLSFIPEIILGTMMGKNYDNTYAEITVEGKLYKKILLSEHRGEEEFKVKTEDGYNLIVLKDNSIAIIDADCPDKVCMKPGFISKPGESLVCLPHKLMVEVKGNTDIDDIIISH
jgi:hypothetical protein